MYQTLKIIMTLKGLNMKILDFPAMDTWLGGPVLGKLPMSMGNFVSSYRIILDIRLLYP